MPGLKPTENFVIYYRRPAEDLLKEVVAEARSAGWAGSTPEDAREPDHRALRVQFTKDRERVFISILDVNGNAFLVVAKPKSD